jgi:hypothetical protein
MLGLQGCNFVPLNKNPACVIRVEIQFCILEFFDLTSDVVTIDQHNNICPLRKSKTN